MSEPAPAAGGHDDWDAHWKQYAEAAEANPAQHYRHRLALRLLDLPADGVRLMDVGSGQGDFLAAAARACPQASLSGIELSAYGISVAGQKVPHADLRAVDVTDPTAIPDAWSGWATHMVCSEVLEHVDDDRALLAGARRLLAPGARVVITVPGGPMSAFDRHIGHRRHYSRDRLRSVVRDSGLRVERIMAAGFPAFTLYRLLVLARGRRLAQDVDADAATQSTAARAAMAAFEPLFRRAALDDFPWGWQMVAVASAPPA